MAVESKPENAVLAVYRLPIDPTAAHAPSASSRAEVDRVLLSPQRRLVLRPALDCGRFSLGGGRSGMFPEPAQRPWRASRLRLASRHRGRPRRAQFHLRSAHPVRARPAGPGAVAPLGANNSRPRGATVVVHFLGSVETAAPFMYLFHIILACVFFPPAKASPWPPPPCSYIAGAWRAWNRRASCGRPPSYKVFPCRPGTGISFPDGSGACTWDRSWQSGA